jgi:hypothetical protein
MNGTFSASYPTKRGMAKMNPKKPKVIKTQKPCFHHAKTSLRASPEIVDAGKQAVRQVASTSVENARYWKPACPQWVEIRPLAERLQWVKSGHSPR